jgi:hypothetical protein
VDGHGHGYLFHQFENFWLSHCKAVLLVENDEGFVDGQSNAAEAIPIHAP